MSRLKFLTKLLFARVVWARSVEVSTLQKRCTFGTAGWSPDNEDWVAADTDNWTTTWWNSQSSENKTTFGFSTLLGLEFIPTDPSWGCNIGHTATCQISDCELVQTGGNPAPYFVLLSLQYFTQQMTDYYNALFDGVTAATTNIIDFSTTFSNPFISDTTSIALKEIINTLNYLIFAGLALGGASAVMAALGTLVAGGIEATGPFVSTSDPDAYTLQEMSLYGEFLSQFLNQSASSIGTMTSNLLFGDADFGGNYIWDWFKNATYASLELSPQNGPNAINTQQWATEFMTTMTIASGINSLWKQSNVYIVAASAQNGDCASDNRAPSEVKYCRTDVSDGNIYAIYTITNGQVQAPPGYDKMSSYGNVTLGQAILSSIKAYEAAKFNYINVQGARWVDAMLNWGVGNRPVDLWAAFEGVFTLAVCVDAVGYALASLGSTKSFPCSCGNGSSESGPFGAASFLQANTDYMNFCGAFNPGAATNGPSGSPAGSSSVGLTGILK